MKKRSWWTVAGVSAAGVAAAVGVAVATPAMADDASTGSTPRGHGPALTDEQKSCLAAAGLTKPDGKPTDEQRAAFEAAAANCGIALPQRGDGPQGAPSGDPDHGTSGAAQADRGANGTGDSTAGRPRPGHRDEGTTDSTQSGTAHSATGRGAASGA